MATSGNLGTNITWSYNDQGELKITGSGVMPDFDAAGGPWGNNVRTITINEGITTIGKYAFYDNTWVTSVSLPDSLTSIGDYAFYKCWNLPSIKIPDNVTNIGHSAFNDCYDLAEVNLPNGIKEILPYTFQNCCMERIEIPGNVKEIGESAFEWNDSLKEVVFENGVEKINAFAFRYTGLTQVTFSESILQIGTESFCMSDLKSIDIPNSVTFIGEGAFSDCDSLVSINVDESNQNYSSVNGNLFNKKKTVLIQYAIGKSESSYMIPDSVTSIGNYAFQNCDNLTSVTIPDSVTSIGNNAFEGCSNLTTVIFKGTEEDWENISKGQDNDSLINASIYYYEGKCGENVTYKFDGIDTLTISGVGEMYDYGSTENPFAPWNNYRTQIKKVVIQSDVTSIGDDAFYDCTELKTVYYKGSEEEWNNINVGINNDDLTEAIFIYYSGKCGDNLTWEFDGSGSLTISGTGKMYDFYSKEYPESPSWLNYWNDIEEIKIENGVTSIGNFAFAELVSLKNIDITDGVENIGLRAFADCGNLETLIIPNTVLSIEDEAFSGCFGLKTIDISSTVIASIADKVFYGCSVLTEINIPNNVTSIGDFAFYGCSVLTEINISENIESIGTHAFGECMGLTSINVDEDNQNYSSIDGVLFSKDKTELIQYAIGKTDEEYTVPDGVVCIGESAFAYCNYLSFVVLPISVNYIGAYAFYGCSMLLDFSCKSETVNLKSEAFTGCNGILFYQDSTDKYHCIRNLANGKAWLVKGNFNETDIKLDNNISLIGENAIQVSNEIKNVKIILPFSIKYLSQNAIVFRKDEQAQAIENIEEPIAGQGTSQTLEIICKDPNVRFDENGIVEGISSENVIISCYLSDIYKMEDIIYLANYSSSIGYKFVLYYLTAEEKKEAVIFRNKNNIEAELFYCGEKGLLNIKLPNEECKINVEVFKNRKIDILDISKTTVKLTKKSLTGSIINQLNIPYIGGFDEDDKQEEYFSYLYGEDRFNDDNIDIEESDANKNNENNKTILNLPTTVVLNNVEIEEIPEFAFAFCGIENIELPYNLTTIGQYAFYHTLIKNINIPKQVCSIGTKAFYSINLENENEEGILKSISWLSNVGTNKIKENSIGDNVFYVKKEEGIKLQEQNKIKNSDFSSVTISSYNTHNNAVSEIDNWSEFSDYYNIYKKERGLYLNATNSVSEKGKVYPITQELKGVVSEDKKTTENQIVYGYAKVKYEDGNIETTNCGYPTIYLSYKINGETDEYTHLPVWEDKNNISELRNGEWHILSTRCETLKEGQFLCDRIAFGIRDAQLYDNMYIQEIKLFNLTEMFGAGFEPTKEWCDNNLVEADTNTTIQTPLYPEINGIKFLDSDGNKFDVAEGNLNYIFDYENGIIKNKDNTEIIEGYFSFPYYIFTGLNNELFYSEFIDLNGNCGKEDETKLQYYLVPDVDNENGYILNFSGEGEMMDCTSNSSPWNSYSDRITKIVFPKRLTRIGNYAFQNCVNLTSVVFEEKLQSIGSYAFSGCTKLENVKLNVNLKNIGDNAFSGCSAIKNIEFNQNLLDIGKEAFNGCSLNYLSLISQESALKIGEGAFKNNNTLIEVNIQKATSIGKGCFSYCPNLTKITLPFVGSTGKTRGIESLLSYVIGTEKKEELINENIYDEITQVYVDTLNSAIINSVTMLISNKLKEIYILGGNVYMGAFSGLNEIDKIILKNINTLDHNIFWGIDSLNEIEVPYRELKGMNYYFSANNSYGSSCSGYNFIENLFTYQGWYYSSSKDIYINKGKQFSFSDSFRGDTDNGSYWVQIANNLNKITITEGNLNEIGKFSYWVNENLELNFPDNTSAKLLDSCFAKSIIKKIYLNVNPTIISACCFYEAKINSINDLTWNDFFLNLRQIEASAFYKCEFTNQEIEKLIIRECTAFNYAFNGMKAIKSIDFSGKSLGTYCFADSEFEEIKINITEEIGDYAFANCEELKILNIINCTTIGAHILLNCKGITTIITPFVGRTKSDSSITQTSNINSFQYWLKYSSRFAYTTEREGYYNTLYGSMKYECSQKLPNFTKLIVTKPIELISYKFYDMGRWFPNLKIYLTEQNRPTSLNSTIFGVYPSCTLLQDEFYYFKGEYDENELVPYLNSPAKILMRSLGTDLNNLDSSDDFSNQQKVIKLLNNKDYSWKALLYGKDYDVYITDNNTYSEGTSDLPFLYLPNNSKMKKGHQINLIGEDIYKIKDLEEFSYSNKIFYRQSKGVVSGKLNYFNTVTGLIKKQDENWYIEDTNFKNSLSDTPVKFIIGSTYDSSYNNGNGDGTICIKNNTIEIIMSDGGTKIGETEGDIITIEKAKVTKGSIDATLLNVIKIDSKFTTNTDGTLQTVEEKDNYEISFAPGFYIGSNGYNSVNITVADSELILPNDLLTNTILLSVDTQGKLLLTGTTGDRIKKGVIDKNLIGIIRKGITTFSLGEKDNEGNEKKYIIKDINKETNQIVFETEDQEGYIMDSSESTFTIQLEKYIDFASEKEEEKFNLTDLHLTLNHINIFKVIDIKKYDKLNESSVLKDGEILYLVTTKEVINSTDYEVSERAIEKEFTLERYSTIVTVETIDGSNVQHLLVHPDTYYQINSNYIETPQYYFQTTEEQDINFYVNNEKVVADIVGNLETNIYSSSANIKAIYNGNLIWYKWNIQEEIEGQYYTIKELTEYYNPNINLTYDLFRNERKYRLMLTINTKENLQVVKYLYLNVQYDLDLLNNIIVDKDCKKKAIKISFLKNKNLFLFDNFEEKGQYGGIEHIYIEKENKNLYTYIGEEKYLFYKENIYYMNDYAFSYELTQIANVAIRFYNSNNENISSENVNIISNGVYDETLEAVILQGTNEMIIPYQENTSISYFHIGFYAPQNTYFSSIQLEEGSQVTEYEEPIIDLNNLTLNRIEGYIILREEVDDEDTLCKLAEISKETIAFYDYSFNREITYTYYVVPIYFNVNTNTQVYGAPHKINNPINYNLKEVTLIDTIVDISPTETNTNSNIFLANTEEFAIWHLKYNTEAKNINIVTDKTVYETPMKIPTVNKTNRNYKTGTIKAFLGGFVRENNKLTYRDSIKLQNKFQDFCDNGRVKMLRDEIGNVIPVDITLKSFDYNPHTVPTNITITFDWTQVGEEKDLSVWSYE